MLLFALACTSPSDDSGTTSTGTPVALPSAYGAIGPSCAPDDGGAWDLTLGLPAATCDPFDRTAAADVIWINQEGSQAGPAATGETLTFGTGEPAEVRWRRAGEDGETGEGTLVVAPWTPPDGTISATLTLTGTFAEGPLTTTGDLTAVYCEDPEVICG